MRHLIYTITLIGTILTGCSNGSGDNQTKSISETNNVSSESEGLKKIFQPYFRGVWLPSKYIEELERTKSPLKSYDALNGVSEMFFSEDASLSDTFYVKSGINNHEGFDFNIFLKRGMTEGSLRTDISTYDNKGGFCDIEVQSNSTGTSLNLSTYNVDKHLLKKTAFKKVSYNPLDTVIFSNLHTFVNTFLFVGVYSFIDTNRTTKHVVFKADGQIEGFEDYQNYSITTDFGVKVENNLDNIELCSSEMDCEFAQRDCKLFLYKIVGDTTNLYEPVFVDKEGITYGYGTLLYRLIKQNKN